MVGKEVFGCFGLCRACLHMFDAMGGSLDEFARAPWEFVPIFVGDGCASESSFGVGNRIPYKLFPSTPKLHKLTQGWRRMMLGNNGGANLQKYVFSILLLFRYDPKIISLVKFWLIPSDNAPPKKRRAGGLVPLTKSPSDSLQSVPHRNKTHWQQLRLLTMSRQHSPVSPLPTLRRSSHGQL